MRWEDDDEHFHRATKQENDGANKTQGLVTNWKISHSHNGVYAYIYVLA